jgi:AcrR family transcriptional regulator
MRDLDPEPDEDAEDLGLRQRKKLATREALSLAALRLALERGFDNVRVDDIAAAAGVSPRTYNNYFSSRAEAICAVGMERARRVASALRERPADEPLGEALVRAVVEQHAGRYGVDKAAPDKETIRLIVSNPALRGEFLKTTAAIEAQLAEAIAARTGIDPNRDVGPRVLAAAAASAIRVATEHWLRPDTADDFATVLTDALRRLVPAASALDRSDPSTSKRASLC